MALRPSLALSVSLLALAALTPQAHAEDPTSSIFGQPLGIAAIDPQTYTHTGHIAMGADGDAYAAWGQLPRRGLTSPAAGVWVVRRQVGDVGFAAPQQLSHAGRDEHEDVQVVTDDAGHALVGWTERRGGLPAVVRIALGSAAGGFGEPESVPLDLSHGDPRLEPAAAFALGRDGTVTVAWVQSTDGSAQALYVAVRAPNGVWAPPQRIDGYFDGGPVATTTATGDSFIAVGAHVPTDEPWVRVPQRVLVLRRAAGTLSVAPEKVLAGGLNGNGLTLRLASDRLGNALVSWSAPLTDAVFPPQRLFLTRRTPQGGFGPIGSPFNDDLFIRSVSVDMNDAGDVLIAGAGVTTTQLAASPAGAGGFGSPEVLTYFNPLNGGSREAPGNAMVVAGSDGSGYVFSQIGRHLSVFERPRGGPIAKEPMTISAAGAWASSAAAATDHYGNGVVVFSQERRNIGTTMIVRGFSATPPAVRRLVAGRRALTGRLTAPALLTLSVADRAKMRVRAPAGPLRVTYTAAMRKALAQRKARTVKVSVRGSGSAIAATRRVAVR